MEPEDTNITRVGPDLWSYGLVETNWNSTVGNVTEVAEERQTGGELGIEAWLVPVLVAIIGVVGICGNALVIFIITKYNEMNTPTNHYIVSLAVADLSFLLFCSPFTAYLFATTSWTLGRSMCKFVFYFMQVTVEAACLTMTSLSVDRYLAIVHPIASINYRTPRSAIVVITVIWSLAFLISTPLAVIHDLRDIEWYSSNTYCMEQWSNPTGQKAYWVSIVIFAYVLPLAVGIWSCIRVVQQLWGSNAMGPGIEQLPFQFRQKALWKKRKVCLMIGAMVVVFAVCWLPTHVTILWQVLDTKGFPRHSSMFGVKIFSVILTYLQSALNPFLYVFLGESFRKNLKKEFPCLFRSRRVGSNREAGNGLPQSLSRPLDPRARGVDPLNSGSRRGVTPACPNKIDIALPPPNVTAGPSTSLCSSKERPLTLPMTNLNIFLRQPIPCSGSTQARRVAREQPTVTTSKV